MSTLSRDEHLGEADLVFVLDEDEPAESADPQIRKPASRDEPAESADPQIRKPASRDARGKVIRFPRVTLVPIEDGELIRCEDPSDKTDRTDKSPGHKSSVGSVGFVRGPNAPDDPSPGEADGYFDSLLLEGPPHDMDADPFAVRIGGLA